MMMKFITRKEVPTIVSILFFVASACVGTASSSDSIVIMNAVEAEIMTNLRAKRNNINHHNHLDSYSSVYFNSRLGLIRRRLEEEQEEEAEEEEAEEEEEQENDAEDDAQEEEDDDEEENDDVAEEEEAEDNEEEENEEEEEGNDDDDAAVDEEEEQEEDGEVAVDADVDDDEEEEFDWTSYHSYENKYESMSQSNRIWSIVLVCWWALLIVLTCIFCCEDGSKSSSNQQASNKQPRYICSKCSSKCDSSSTSSSQDSLKEALAVEEDFENVDHENDEIVREEMSVNTDGIQKVCRYYYKKATDEIEF